jgi:hypothetical protein
LHRLAGWRLAWQLRLPVASIKKLLANAGTSLGMELLTICSCIFAKIFDANFTTMETCFFSKILLLVSILFMLIEGA